MADINFNTVPIMTAHTVNATALISDSSPTCKRAILQNLIDLAKNDALTTAQSQMLDRLTSGCKIAFHKTGDTHTFCYPASRWLAKRNKVGVTPDGVLVCEGEHRFIVAPTQGSNVKWSDNSTDKIFTSDSQLGPAYGDRTRSITDFNGKQRTDIILAHPTFADADDTYAAKFCANYSYGGIGAGKWWLPSIGELTMIWMNMKKIEACLALIDGAQLLREGVYWSSTEMNATHAWHLYTTNSFGAYSAGDSKKDYCKVVPVTSFA